MARSPSSGDLGISSAAVSLWLTDKTMPSAENAHKLATLFDDESVYDILGLARPDPDLRWVAANWDRLTREQRKQVRELIRQFAGGEGA